MAGIMNAPAHGGARINDIAPDIIVTPLADGGATASYFYGPLKPQ